ncbi:retrovirus-related pol polyprotein from transposon TNT 1-94 [Tanacetum coccineum]
MNLEALACIEQLPQRLTKSSIYSRSLGLAACASLESKNEVCLLCEVNPKQIPAFDFICASLESILAIEDTWERGEDTVEGDEMLWVYGERTQGVVKTLMNTKRQVDFRIDLVHLATPVAKEHQCRLLRREAWSSFEVSVEITKEGEVVTYLRFIANFSKIVKLITSLTERNQKKERVKPRRVRAMAMTIQYGVRGMISTAQSEAFKQENVPLVGSKMDEAHASRRKPLKFEVGDRVMLKVSPWKGIIQFGNKGKLAPRYVGPFEILERIGPVAYGLRLPEELRGQILDEFWTLWINEFLKGIVKGKMVLKESMKIIREVFVKLLLDSFGKLSVSYAFSVSLLLTPLCCDDIHDVTPRVSALTGCDKRGLHAQVTTVRTDKGTEFLNKTLHAYFAKEGIRHETSTGRTPEQNGIVKRRNRTLVEAAQTMLSATKVPLFFWAKAIATSCFTQNRSLVIPRHEKTPYHIINASEPSSSSFTSLVLFATSSKAYKVFNKRTRMIVETIHVNFDEFPQMVSDHVSSDPGPQCSTTALEQEV